MKKILFTAVSALALAAFADGVNSTEFGVLKVPSSAKETVVAVPWLQSGTGSASVKVADLVLTASFSEGDQLMFYDGSQGQYTGGWVLKVDETSGALKWKGQAIVTTKGTIPAGSDETQIPRGSALMLKREVSTGAEFYIMGKPTSGTGSQTMGAGYSLVAPPSVSNTDVNEGVTWSNIEAGDQLYVPTSDNKMITLTYRTGDNGGWGKVNPESHKWEKTGTINAGMGAWFKNNGSGSGKSFSF